MKSRNIGSVKPPWSMWSKCIAEVDTVRTYFSGDRCINIPSQDESKVKLGLAD